MVEPARKSCLVCGSPKTGVFLEIADQPVHVGVQWPSADAARACPRGDIALVFCRDCGFITNGLFDESVVAYTGEYDNSLSCSPYFRTFARELAERLVSRYDVRQKTVIDIGCGKGDFLRLVCEMGDNRGIGFDPTYTTDEGSAVPNDRVEFVRDCYSSKYAYHQGDLICCRHVFEHVREPQVFLHALREIIGDNPDATLYFEVPNVRTILRDLSVWTIIYEHCSHFAIESLARVFDVCGFAVQCVAECYEGQFLGLEAKPASGARDRRGAAWGDVEQLSEAVTSFSKAYQDIRASWQRRLDQIERTGGRAVAWGAGAKTIGFFNVLNVRNQIPFVVDINPRKHGTYLAGTAQRIVGPEFLREYEPTMVIIMNEVYKHEICAAINHLGLNVEYVYA